MAGLYPRNSAASSAIPLPVGVYFVQVRAIPPDGNTAFASLLRLSAAEGVRAPSPYSDARVSDSTEDIVVAPLLDKSVTSSPSSFLKAKIPRALPAESATPTTGSGSAHSISIQSPPGSKPATPVLQQSAASAGQLAVKSSAAPTLNAAGGSGALVEPASGSSGAGTAAPTELPPTYREYGAHFNGLSYIGPGVRSYELFLKCSGLQLDPLLACDPYSESTHPLFATGSSEDTRDRGIAIDVELSGGEDVPSGPPSAAAVASTHAPLSSSSSVASGSSSAIRPGLGSERKRTREGGFTSAPSGSDSPSAMFSPAFKVRSSSAGDASGGKLFLSPPAGAAASDSCSNSSATSGSAFRSGGHSSNSFSLGGVRASSSANGGPSSSSSLLGRSVLGGYSMNSSAAGNSRHEQQDGDDDDVTMSPSPQSDSEATTSVSTSLPVTLLSGSGTSASSSSSSVILRINTGQPGLVRAAGSLSGPVRNILMSPPAIPRSTSAPIASAVSPDVSSVQGTALKPSRSAAGLTVFTALSPASAAPLTRTSRRSTDNTVTTGRTTLTSSMAVSEEESGSTDSSDSSTLHLHRGSIVRPLLAMETHPHASPCGGVVDSPGSYYRGTSVNVENTPSAFMEGGAGAAAMSALHRLTLRSDNSPAVGPAAAIAGSGAASLASRPVSRSAGFLAGNSPAMSPTQGPIAAASSSSSSSSFAAGVAGSVAGGDNDAANGRRRSSRLHGPGELSSSALNVSSGAAAVAADFHSLSPVMGGPGGLTSVDELMHNASFLSSGSSSSLRRREDDLLLSNIKPAVLAGLDDEEEDGMGTANQLQEADDSFTASSSGARMQPRVLFQQEAASLADSFSAAIQGIAAVQWQLPTEATSSSSSVVAASSSVLEPAGPMFIPSNLAPAAFIYSPQLVVEADAPLMAPPPHLHLPGAALPPQSSSSAASSALDSSSVSILSTGALLHSDGAAAVHRTHSSISSSTSGAGASMASDCREVVPAVTGSAAAGGGNDTSMNDVSVLSELPREPNMSMAGSGAGGTADDSRILETSGLSVSLIGGGGGPLAMPGHALRVATLIERA